MRMKVEKDDVEQVVRYNGPNVRKDAICNVRYSSFVNNENGPGNYMPSWNVEM